MGRGASRSRIGSVPGRYVIDVYALQHEFIIVKLV